MEKRLSNSVDEVIACIVDSDEYKKCVELKEKMYANKELIQLIDDVKSTQKKYIKSGYSGQIKEELDKIEKELDEIPIYVIYKQYLDKVNYKINFVTDFLNDYFESVLNGKSV